MVENRISLSHFFHPSAHVGPILRDTARRGKSFIPGPGLHSLADKWALLVSWPISAARVHAYVGVFSLLLSVTSLALRLVDASLDYL